MLTAAGASGPGEQGRNWWRLGCLAASFAAMALMATSKPASAQNNHTFTIVNNSGFTIEEVHMSLANDPSWRRDLLGRSILRDGYYFTVTGIRPGLYDIEVVDEDSNRCVVNNVRVYEDMTWNLTPLGLVGCEFR